jgi:hypothetical protein
MAGIAEVCALQNRPDVADLSEKLELCYRHLDTEEFISFARLQLRNLQIVKVQIALEQHRNAEAYELLCRARDQLLVTCQQYEDLAMYRPRRG